MSIEEMKQALENAEKVMEAAGKRIDELKAENESLRKSIATEESSATQEPVAFITNRRQRMNVEIKPSAFVWQSTVQDWEIPLYTHPQPNTEQDEVDIRSRLYQRVHELEAVLKDIAEYTGEGPSTTDWQGIVKLISDSARSALGEQI